MVKEYKNRSYKQHKSEWMYYRIISDETGHTSYEIYMFMSRQFLKVLDEEGDECIIKPTSLNTAEHNNYMEQIRAFVSEFGILLPDPEAIEFVENYLLKKL